MLQLRGSVKGFPGLLLRDPLIDLSVKRERDTDVRAGPPLRFYLLHPVMLSCKTSFFVVGAHSKPYNFRHPLGLPARSWQPAPSRTSLERIHPAFIPKKGCRVYVLTASEVLTFPRVALTVLPSPRQEKGQRPVTASSPGSQPSRQLSERRESCCPIWVGSQCGSRTILTAHSPGSGDG